MNRNKLIIGIVTAVLLVGGVAFGLSQANSSDESAMMAKESSDTMMKDDTKDSMSKDDDAMAKNGAYVTLTDYNANSAKYANSTKVYFFHAPWCPSCKAVEAEIEADPSKIPQGVTLIKTDFDTETKLRQKYGVTIQHTFVQVDEQGNQVAKWSAESLDAVIRGVQG